MILDTSFLIDLLRGEAAAEEAGAALDEAGHGVVTAVSVMELWEGIHLADSCESERRAVQELLTGLQHADLDRPAAMRAGASNAVLAAEGTAVAVEDVMIAAIAAEVGQPVLTRNVEDFERLPDVAVETY